MPAASPRKPAADGHPSAIILGRREYVDLPDWGVPHLVAKIDTGARSSAIDVVDIEELPGERVRFTVVFDRDDKEARKTIEAPIVRRTHVKSSLGHKHDRLFVRTQIRLGDVITPIELGLVGRKRMQCRMLLGRTFLRGGYLVDCRRKHALGRKKAVSHTADQSPPPAAIKGKNKP
jgi:hypothetical protein